jgi:hypothetical protein
MTEAEMLARMDSRELTRWWTLYQIEADEVAEQRHRLDSDDGTVVFHGRDEDEDGDDEPESL